MGGDRKERGEERKVGHKRGGWSSSFVLKRKKNSAYDGEYADRTDRRTSDRYCTLSARVITPMINVQMAY